jgi:hypothetical protein
MPTPTLPSPPSLITGEDGSSDEAEEGVMDLDDSDEGDNEYDDDDDDDGACPACRAPSISFRPTLLPADSDNELGGHDNESEDESKPVAPGAWGKKRAMFYDADNADIEIEEDSDDGQASSRESVSRARVLLTSPRLFHQHDWRRRRHGRCRQLVVASCAPRTLAMILLWAPLLLRLPPPRPAKTSAAKM